MAGALVFAGCEEGATPSAGTPETAPQRPSHVVLALFDTLRADRMSIYGHTVATTPTLDGMADEVLRYSAAQATGSWTVPAHASIFTGLWPSEHGAQWGDFVLDPEHTTLAEALSEAGFCTVGVSTNGFVRETTGFAQGFRQFEYVEVPTQVGARFVLDHAREALRTAVSEGCRLFLFLNFMDTHLPYNYRPYADELGVGVPPIQTHVEKWAASAGILKLDNEGRRRQRAAYDAAVRSVDDHVAALLAMLTDAGLLESTLLVLTSDHGEGLGAHREWGHSLSVWEEQLRVPLIVRFPERRRGGEVFERRVSMVGLAASILDWLAVPRPPAFRRAPTLEETAETPITADYRDYFSETGREGFNRDMREQYPELARTTRHRHVLYCGAHKLIVAPPDEGETDPVTQYYDLSRDPEEQSGLPADAACLEEYRRLAAAGRFTPFDRIVQPSTPSNPEIEVLRSLGYIQ